jgi:mRNA interferase MazF
LQVVPLTSNIGKLYPSEALVFLGGQQHKAIADQLSTVSKLRLSTKIGQLSINDIQKIEEAIKTQLDLI